MLSKVYFNHDGGVDDLISLFLLLQMDDIELVGVSTIGADCYLEPSVSASCKIINRFSNKSLQVKRRTKNAKAFHDKCENAYLGCWVLVKYGLITNQATGT
ncbi:hypothetical protein ACTMNS_11885, partial [Staphylococcus haemolyticus]